MWGGSQKPGKFSLKLTILGISIGNLTRTWWSISPSRYSELKNAGTMNSRATLCNSHIFIPPLEDWVTAELAKRDIRMGGVKK